MQLTYMINEMHKYVDVMQKAIQRITIPTKWAKGRWLQQQLVSITQGQRRTSWHETPMLDSLFDKLVWHLLLKQEVTSVHHYNRAACHKVYTVTQHNEWWQLMRDWHQPTMHMSTEYRLDHSSDCSSDCSCFVDHLVWLIREKHPVDCWLDRW